MPAHPAGRLASTPGRVNRAQRRVVGCCCNDRRRAETDRSAPGTAAAADAQRGTIMSGPSAYDGTIQMFIDQPRSLDLQRLRFLRWLAERGRLEHAIAG